MAIRAIRTAELDAAGWRCVAAHGAWPFITRLEFLHEDSRRHTWVSRVHRKALLHPVEPVVCLQLWRWVWAPGRLNWWIGTVFALGSLLFAVGCVLSLAPAWAARFNLNTTQVNGVFFAGSVPFTTAAYLQLFQAANAPEALPPGVKTNSSTRVWFGWQPKNAGWLSCALQFIGTVLFNINTFDAMWPGLTRMEQELGVWLPNLIGSVLFLASGYLAFIETCHAHWAWKVWDLSWWIVFINLTGCTGFMIAAVFAYVPVGVPNEHLQALSLAFTLQGALCFLLGSLLMLPEGVAGAAATNPGVDP